VLWFTRLSVADNAIAGELAKRGIPARYKVAQIGFGWQRLEAISLGDPARPDLTADWAEVRLVAGWNGVTADAVRAGGVRLRGRLVNGKVSWGVLDKLLPQGTGGPFTLPAIHVMLDDARLALATAYGPVGAKIDGRGRLSDGFSGKLAAVMPVLAVGSCRIERATAWVDIAIRQGSPVIKGPLRIRTAACGGVSLMQARSAIDVTLSPALDSWRGTIAPEVESVVNPQGFASNVRGTIEFSGNAAKTSGTASLASPYAMVASNRIDGAALDGRFAVTPAGFDWQGRANAARVALSDAARTALGNVARAGDGTPLAPLAAALANAALRAGTGASAEADLSLGSRAGAFAATVSGARVSSISGAVLRISGGRGLGFDGTAITADTRLTLSGGGFPAIDADLKRTANGESRGTARIAPLVAGGARLSLTPVQFLARDDGYVRIVTVASLDGPFGGGRVEGLRTPLVVARLPDGSIAANPGCGPLVFRRLQVQSLVLNATVLEVCAEGPMLLRTVGGRLAGGAIVTTPRLSGAIGSTPLALAASRARIGFGDGGVAVSNLSARLGRSDQISRLEIGALDGKIAGSGIAGRFANLSGQIGKVPLLIDEGGGDWRFARGALELSARARVSDEDQSPRFNPLMAENLKLRLADSRVIATAVLREPKSNTAVAAVDLSHDLNTGTGRATLDVADLRFNSRFQPEALTSLTIGVVASVQGAIAGRGDIAWNASGVTSTGRFRTNRLDFAAAFGPVDGAAGEVVFTDLLGLVTAPGQVVTLASVNPGIPVLDGRVTYRIEPGRRIVVEGGAWPFAGGQLVMVPTVLAMGEAQERRLTFRVVGLDAARFIETLDFDNLAATGVFDGSIPMVFNGEGGRIEGGEIVARPGGGTIAYVGEVSNAQMNVYAKMAFDALKAIRYSNLAIGLNGPLDGEMVSNVTFRGVNQDPASKPKGIVARAIKGLPFKFNIVIRAPFRGLLTTARDLQDPTSLIRRAAPLPPPPGSQPVQPAESEKR
jgi:translocation and assembly module TamB